MNCFSQGHDSHHGRVRTTTTSCNITVILQLLGQPRHMHAALHIWDPCYGQLIPVKARYPLTSITWPYHELRFRAHWGQAGLFFAGCRVQNAGWNLIITGKPLALKIMNNLYTRQGFLHKVARLFHIVRTRSIRYKYLSIDTLRPVKSLRSHLNGHSTDVSIDSRIGSGLPIGLHMRIFILPCHLCMQIRTI